MCCGKACLKTSSLIFLVTFTIISIAEITCGTYMLVYMYKINRPETIGQLYIAIPSLSLILFGIALLPLIVLGSCGFCKEVACCVNMYSAILLILSILQILVGIFAIITFVKNNTLRDQIKEDFEYSFKHYRNDALFLNTIQKEMHCCGKTLPTDWGIIKLPSSCCGDSEAECELNSESLYGKGCTDVVTGFVLLWNSIIGYYSVIIGVIEMIVTILGFSLGCGSFKNYYMV